VQKLALEHGAETLPEVHDHPSFQYAIALHGMRPYGFALPPLVLHAMLDADARYLKRYLRMCPRNQISVLDTHDGICIPDVEGFLPQHHIQDLIDNVSTRSADPILRRSAANVHSVGAIYQLTCTFFDALKQNEDANVAARAIQFFAPGIPQIYYVGWLGGTNEVERAEDTGDPREINRHYYTREDVDKAVKEPMVRRLTRLMEFRSTYPAFQGTFHLQYSNDKSLSLAWRKDEYRCELFVDLIFKKATITYNDPRSGRALTIKC
jgi:sucrose phosphorylase